MSGHKHIVLTSHPSKGGPRAPEIHWGARTPTERGPVIGSSNNPAQRNVVGVHSGAYGVYRALAVAAGKLDPVHRPDLTNTFPPVAIGPFEQWFDPDKIVSLDPWGHRVAEVFKEEIAAGLDIRPTIAITKARISFPEIRDAIAARRLASDNRVLLPSAEANVTKVAIEPVWYLPGLANRLGVKEAALRRALFEHTGAMFPDLVTRPDRKVFLPPIGNITLYIFGEVERLWDGKGEITCRVHDECNGSDVFGSDICTCRPYLAHGIEECIRSAQKGGVGLIVYNRKEGRALGEVVKFLVYNARKRHTGGDSAAAYFERTECVAGVQDMRFQDLMPDVFHWLGMRRIDRWISMSNMKFEPMRQQGIEIVDRVPIPDELIPPDAQVEMDAKKAAGYYTDDTVSKPDDLSRTKGRGLDDYWLGAADGLLSAVAVRARCAMILEAGLAGRLPHFRVAIDRLDEAARYVAETVRINYPSLDVPFHSRWRHFVIEGQDRWQAVVEEGLVPADRDERARTRFEVAIVSVLLDAGAGSQWRWAEPVAGVDGKARWHHVGRSEGLALASLDAWRRGYFSSSLRAPRIADAGGLRTFSAADLAKAFMVVPGNELVGLEGRALLLNRLGDTIASRPELFGEEGRLGGLYDTMVARAGQEPISAPSMLRVVLEALGPIWPGRERLGGVDLGDTWRHPTVVAHDATNGLVPFHKLSQWLTYSLIEPMREAGHDVADLDGLTGLAEYRNGGLFLDLGVIQPRDAGLLSRTLLPGDEAIVEWRALTVALLDRIAPLVRSRLGVTADRMPLCAVLEGGTWSAGRRIARERRADGGPPLTIASDGSVF